MAQSPQALIEGAPGLLSAEFPVIPRLAGGSDVRELAGSGTVVMADPSEVTADLADRLVDGSSTETHNKNRIAPPDFVSILERLRQLRHTAVGRAAIIIAMATPLAACGHSHQGNILSGQPPAAVAQKDAGQGGGDHGADRVIIGDAACYEGFATLTAEAQAKCADEFTGFSLEQVARLSPLDQARWAYDYHHKVTDGEDGDRLAWSKMFEAQSTTLDLANNWLSFQTQDVIRLAWMMQQPDQKSARQRSAHLGRLFWHRYNRRFAAN